MTNLSDKCCPRCSVPKSTDNCRVRKNGAFDGYCKKCASAAHYEWYLRNKEEDHNESKKYRERNKDKVLNTRRAYEKSDCARMTRSSYRQSAAERNPGLKVRYVFGSYIHNALRKGKMYKRLSDVLGCGLVEFKAHLERNFKPGMSWDNYGYHGWHVDHIQPCSKFNLLDPHDLEKCYHYTNTQPLWRSENQSKGNK